MSRLIYHITSRRRWEAAQAAGVYRADTLDTQGCMHASHREQVLRVANARYRGQGGLVLLCIDPARVRPEIHEERGDPASQERFPHIYGSLNLDAVEDAFPFEPGPGGTFALPAQVVRA
jgi:uncharacterized protein (DUF952 family)